MDSRIADAEHDTGDITEHAMVHDTEHAMAHGTENATEHGTKHGTEPGRSRMRVACRITFNVGVAILIAGIFCLKIVNYVNPGSLQLPVMARGVSTLVNNTVSAISNLPVLNTCARGLRMQDVPGGFVCAQGSGHGIYGKIYQTYPLVGKGRESIYASTDQGSIVAANDLLRDKFDLPRFRPVQLPSLPTWSENAYAVPYWRFEFYSLRPSLNLLYAYRTTGKVTYARQLLRLDSSFIAAESRSRWAWAEPHAVAFRCMALVDTWWKMRQDHQLPEAASTAILKELEKTGRFLANPNNYQPGENHGANEAAALYQLAVAFPTLPHAASWLVLAEDRFRWQLDGIIDADGQLIENSPYYDFYTLEKYWQIYDYSLAQGYPISGDFERRLRSMLNFATYILQPNSQVPLLGASIEETINDHGVYAAMAASDPQLQYVLSRGAQGTAPSRSSVYFPASSLAVMRSGWGNPAGFTRSTYLTYNVGRYRTAHSDLDALGLTLYGDGGDLLPDPGLYTYVAGRFHDYFHGTVSHNAVVVDGRSQDRGNGTAGSLVTRDGLTYQSAESSLYPGVTHRRLVMMIDADHVLVVDRLSSATRHRYQQMFHLFPGARLSKSGLTVSGTGGTPRREVTIAQLRPGGITESDVIGRTGAKPDGLCSGKYGQLLPCYAISYSARGRNATFVTLLTIGPPRQTGFSVTAGDGGQRLQITAGGRHVGISLGESTAIAPGARATDPVPPRARPVARSTGKLAFVFDDGYQSILPAAGYLHRSGMPGNVAVIGQYVDYPTQYYLNVFQLKGLQGNWGWDMVNETQHDAGAVRQYYDRHDLSGYAADIVRQAAWLEANGLNSAPNWLVYPYGSTNAELERVVSRYYMFAEGGAYGLDAYPHRDPRDIPDLEVQYPGDGEGGDPADTSPAEILSAVHQAVIHHLTLILTFRGIDSEEGDRPGYPLSLFRQVVDGVRKSGIKVMTLSQLDRSNDVPVNNRIYVNSGQPSQITVRVSS